MEEEEKLEEMLKKCEELETMSSNSLKKLEHRDFFDGYIMTSLFPFSLMTGMTGLGAYMGWNMINPQGGLSDAIFLGSLGSFFGLLINSGIYYAGAPNRARYKLINKINKNIKLDKTDAEKLLKAYDKYETYGIKGMGG